MSGKLLVAVVGVTAVLLAACGGNTGASPSPSASEPTGTINMTMNTAYKKATEQWIANFTTAHPQVQVKVTYLTSLQIAQVIPTQFQAGNAPDIFWMGAGSGGPVTAVGLGKTGKLMDLSQRPWIKDFAADISEASYNGKVYGLPVGVTPAGIFYNSQLFKQLGLTVPMTINELLAMCKQVAATGKIPIATAMGAGTSSLANTTWALALIPPYQQNPNWTQDRSSGKLTFAASPVWQRSFQMLLDMKTAGCFPPHPEGMGLADVAGLVSSGKAVMLLDNSAQLAGMQAANPGMNVLDSTFALPAETAAQTRVLVYVSPVIGINNLTTNRGAALAFLDFLAQTDQNKLFNDASAQVSPAAATRGQLPSWGAGLSTYFKDNKTISNPSATWPNPNLTITLLADLTGLFTGQKTVDAVLKDLDAGWNG